MNKPNYYAIIPAEVRYSENLTPNAKLLYGEISALCNKEGYCWATNAYFAKLYKTTNVTISRWFSNLEKEGFISTQMQFDSDKKQVTKRLTKLINHSERINKNVKGGINKDVKDNILPTIDNNNTSKLIDNAFDDLILKCFDNILPLFKEDYRPKSKKDKINWLKAIESLDKKEGINPRQVYYIISKTLSDSFWIDNFRSPLKLLRKDKNGIKWVYIFKNKYAKDMQV